MFPSRRRPPCSPRCAPRRSARSASQAYVPAHSSSRRPASSTASVRPPIGWPRPLLAARYPGIRVDPDVLYVDEGRILTSAGAAAGLDLCLHLVRRDLGADAAGHAARLCVMPLERAGGQAQFIEHATPGAGGGSLEAALEWTRRHLHEPLRVVDLARRVGMSERTFNRRFREQVGTTPARWLARERVLRAQRLLESSDLPVEQVADRVGFGSAVTLRQRFGAVVGTSPQAWRQAFRAATTPRLETDDRVRSGVAEVAPNAGEYGGSGPDIRFLRRKSRARNWLSPSILPLRSSQPWAGGPNAGPSRAWAWRPRWGRSALSAAARRAPPGPRWAWPGWTRSP
jgi:AraC-like DNA-binding protein